MSYRVQHRFWLDLDKEGESDLNNLIVYLKKNRQFQASIRDGLRLIYDLGQGNTGVLFELCPWLVDELMERTRSSGGGGNGGAGDEIQRQLERLEELLLQQSIGPKLAEAKGPKAMNVSQVAGPVVEDDEIKLAVKKTQGDGKASSNNFLSSALNLLNQ